MSYLCKGFWRKKILNVYSTDRREEIGKTGDHSRHFQTSTWFTTIIIFQPAVFCSLDVSSAFLPWLQPLHLYPKKAIKGRLLGSWAPQATGEGIETTAVIEHDTNWQSRNLKQSGNGGQTRVGRAWKKRYPFCYEGWRDSLKHFKGYVKKRGDGVRAWRRIWGLRKGCLSLCRMKPTPNLRTTASQMVETFWSL